MPTGKLAKEMNEEDRDSNLLNSVTGQKIVKQYKEPRLASKLCPLLSLMYSIYCYCRKIFLLLVFRLYSLLSGLFVKSIITLLS